MRKESTCRYILNKLGPDAALGRQERRRRNTKDASQIEGKGYGSIHVWRQAGT